MSELKAYRLWPDEVRPGVNLGNDYYLKSEADKVIEELKEKHKTEVKELLCLIRDKENNFNRAFDSEEKEIAELKEKSKVQTSIAEEGWKLKDAYHTSYAEAVTELYKKNKELRHHKYKRCLDMAKWCENAILGWMGHRESYSSQQRYIKVMLYTKWHKRWLEIAEQFKEEK